MRLCNFFIVLILITIPFLFFAQKEYIYGFDAFINDGTDFAADNDRKPLTGIVRERYAAERFEWEAVFKDGKKDGLQTEGFIENGVQVGEGREYYDSGTLKRETVFKNGKLEGSAKTYQLNGVVLEAVYRDGVAESACCISPQRLRTCVSSEKLYKIDDLKCK